MNLNYKILFSIELLHEYFLNNKCTDIEIIPAEDCLQLSKGMHLHWRFIDNRLVALVRENGNDEPFININTQKLYRKHYGKTVFRFYLKMKNPDFLHYTNIDFSRIPAKKLYFSNLASNNQSGKLFLSTPVNEHSLGNTYFPGNIVKDPSSGQVLEAIKKHVLKKKSQLSDDSLWVQKGLLQLSKPVPDHAAGKMYMQGDLARKPDTDQVYEAVKKHTATNVSELEDNALWYSRGTGILQYPSVDDIYEYTDGNYIFNVSEPVTKAEISVMGFNFDPEKPAFNLPVLPAETRTFEKPVTQIPVNLSSYRPGRYVIKINKQSKTVYNDPSRNGVNHLGIIEIFNHLPGTDEYSLLTEDEKIKNIIYSIQFSNRRVLWKYVRKDEKAARITDSGENGYSFQLEGDDFISTTPIPLSESIIKTFTLEFNTKDFRVHPLPNPQIHRLTKCNRHDFDYLCSEIYLNY